jgi:hypothetical protein
LEDLIFYGLDGLPLDFHWIAEPKTLEARLASRRVVKKQSATYSRVTGESELFSKFRNCGSGSIDSTLIASQVGKVLLAPALKCRMLILGYLLTVSK